MTRRVAVTGIGLLTPCGLGWKPYWLALLEARSFIRAFSAFPVNGFPAKVAGEIAGFNPEAYVKQRKLLKVMSREIQLAVAASCLAVEDSGVDLARADRSRFGISLGTGIINNDLDEIGVGIRNGILEDGRFSMAKFGQDGIRSLFPLWFLKYLPNMPACHVSIAHGLSGPSNTVTTSSAAGLQAVGEAFRTIQRGDADLMLAGSTDSKVNAMGISRFHLLGLLSRHNHVPEKAYCPFDERHDGIVLGEGAGLLVLEELEHARGRGARVYAEISGYGSSSDFNYDPASKEDYNGKRLAMLRALEDSSVAADDVDFILANGSGIPVEDIQEAHAIRAVFNRFDALTITGVKPITGHLVYGSGGVESGAAALALHERVIPPLANLEKPDADCDLPFVKEKPSARDSRFVLVNSFGFGGQNAAMVLAKP